MAANWLTVNRERIVNQGKLCVSKVMRFNRSAMEIGLPIRLLRLRSWQPEPGTL